MIRRKVVEKIQKKMAVKKVAFWQCQQKEYTMKPPLPEETQKLHHQKKQSALSSKNRKIYSVSK
jgi:hypothetical protein